MPVRKNPAAIKIWPGQSYPLGATYDGAGVNFSIFSEIAEHIELCLFDDDGNERRVNLPEVTSFCHHGYVRGLQPGQRYGFRVHGPWALERGFRCNPAKFLLDPYARAIEGQVEWNEALYPYHFANPEGSKNDLDSARFMPKSVVTNPYFDWGNDRHPRIPLHQTIIYEVHVKGFSELHPDIPADLRGTYAGLAHPVSIEHFKRLGITAVELMPVHQFVHDQHLVEKGLRNYWGYNSIGYLAPHNEYSSAGQAGQQVQDFKQMVKTLHEAGIEVILDVVYNHTAEGNHLGPVLSMKGIDNAAYYRLMANDPRYYMDYTGTGNTLNVRHPQVLQLIMDSLRYWVTEMHVDGFRFDLAATLARELHAVDRLSAFFDLIHQDPIVGQAKLIAEPWDVGEGGYQVGNFPPQWSEWNGKYRDSVRDYWRGMDQTLGEFANRFTGSSDLYATTGRRPFASINFITAHDGFTLADLVSYNEKHNEANGEGDRDGESHNRSWNCGAEGPTDDQTIEALRLRQRRNFMATLFLSQGIPMMLGGDEIGRTQQGNNNAYCQDNEISWFNWKDADRGFLEFVATLINIRKSHPIFRRRRYFLGRPIHGIGVKDIGWFRPDGHEMTDDDWNKGFAKSLGVFLNGNGILSLDERGERLTDDSFYVIFNAHYEPLIFTLPPLRKQRIWVEVADTNEGISTVSIASEGMNGNITRDERQRLNELLDYRILDTQPEQAFDDMTALAAKICKTPFAYISFIDQHRQWIKSKVGLTMNETPRDDAFSTLTLTEQNLQEVPDAATDERFAQVSMVVSEPRIRFYAEAPIVSPKGHVLGAVSVLDREPRTLTPEQRDALVILSRQVMNQLELRKRLLGVPEATGNGKQNGNDTESRTLSTSEPGIQIFRKGEKVMVEARSTVLLRLVKDDAARVSTAT